MRALGVVCVCALALLTFVVFVGCRPGADQVPDLPESSPTAAPSTPEETRTTGAESLAILATLASVPRQPAVRPYERAAFGYAWADLDGNGCNQRDDVLLRDADPLTVLIAPQGACDHDVLAGTWRDPYTGTTMTFDDLKDLRQAQAIQIDHVVPLAEAWISGASEWSDDQRLAYANDLENLLAVDGPTNASKGAYDPAAWRPKKAFQCAYAIRWVDTKSRWELAVDRSERRALWQMLRRCDETS